ncbi:MAG: hypothetical protein Q7R63_00950 [bacterium]|nr:hypothetical protein [bacterium]
MDLPLLFVLYITTKNEEVVCINHNGLLILPRYEPERIYGNEAITNALARQMQESMRVNGKVHLVDTERHRAHEPEKNTFTDLHADHDEDYEDDDYLEALLHGIDPRTTPEEIAMKDDSPFHVCVATNCVPCEKEPEDHTTARWVQWGRWAQTVGNDDDIETWDAKRKADKEHEKKIMRMPIERWNDMIMCGEITDKISIMATTIAQVWIATVKPPSFPRKNQRKARM